MRTSPLGLSAPNHWADSAAIPGMRGLPPLRPEHTVSVLLDVVVGSLAGDDDIVHVALAQAGAGDAHELRPLLKILDTSAAEVTHARLQATYELVHHGFQRSAVRHSPFNAFRNEFGEPVLAVALTLHHA